MTERRAGAQHQGLATQDVIWLASATRRIDNSRHQSDTQRLALMSRSRIPGRERAYGAGADVCSAVPLVLGNAGRMAASSVSSEALAMEALEWLVSQARPYGDGLAWTGTPTAPEPNPNPNLYSGTAGVVMALLEAYRHDGDDRWATAASAGARTLERLVDHYLHDHSLYFGAMGVAVALGAVGDQLADAAFRSAAYRILGRVRSDFDGERWGDGFELLAGNAGIALGALRLGEVDLAELAVTPYLTTSKPTEHGLTWENRRGQPARRHHIPHGTLGVVFALAATAPATGRSDLMQFALAGVADVVARNEAGPEGFLVPHSDPQQQHERIERYSYGWCHGPAGDAQAFRLLGQLTGEASWVSLEERCTPCSPRDFHAAKCPASGTTTAAAAAPPACSPSHAIARSNTVTGGTSPTCSLQT